MDSFCFIMFAPRNRNQPSSERPQRIWSWQNEFAAREVWFFTSISYLAKTRFTQLGLSLRPRFAFKSFANFSCLACQGYTRVVAGKGELPRFNQTSLSRTRQARSKPKIWTSFRHGAAKAHHDLCVFGTGGKSSYFNLLKNANIWQSQKKVS